MVSNVSAPAVANWRTACIMSRSPRAFGGTAGNASNRADDSNSISPVHTVFVVGRAGLSMTLVTLPCSTVTVLKWRGSSAVVTVIMHADGCAVNR